MQSEAEIYDLDRLEDAVEALVTANEKLRAERDTLQSGLAKQQERVSELEGELLEANQRRKDVAKRIDELIGQIDELDSQLEASSAEPSA